MHFCNKVKITQIDPQRHSKDEINVPIALGAFRDKSPAAIQLIALISQPRGKTGFVREGHNYCWKAEQSDRDRKCEDMHRDVENRGSLKYSWRVRDIVIAFELKCLVASALYDLN